MRLPASLLLLGAALGCLARKIVDHYRDDPDRQETR